jgi:hypothetical protein
VPGNTSGSFTAKTPQTGDEKTVKNEVFTIAMLFK